MEERADIDVEPKSANADSLFSAIRLYFNEIVEEVIDSKALLNVSVNRAGHLEFKAELPDKASNATSADRGRSYRKLICVAFDLALICAHLVEAFPLFAYHDGVLESLDDRKKEVLISVLRRYIGMGIQSIVTLIDPDLPKRPVDQPFFDGDEIVLLLHDEGESGRLFKMPSWKDGGCRLSAGTPASTFDAAANAVPSAAYRACGWRNMRAPAMDPALSRRSRHGQCGSGLSANSAPENAT